MIPSILWQTWKTKNIPEVLKPQVFSWKKSNTQLQINLCDDNECSDFILKHFGEKTHKLYLALPQPIMRADFWRLAVVYINGGYYSDLDIICNKNIKDFINPTVDSIFVLEKNNVSNFFFGATPKHPVIKKALDYMVSEAKNIINKDTQTFGMHWLHISVKEHYQITDKYISNNEVVFLQNENLYESKTLMHMVASMKNHTDYVSWRKQDEFMKIDRENTENVLFFTTFNKNGYELYGKHWVDSFIKVANYYNNFKAKIYFEGFIPDIEHQNIQWINYKDSIPFHDKWKDNYFKKTKHSDYVKTMTVRFSHKAFVIQHALKNNNNDYLIWLDGDCIFKEGDYTNFPSNILKDNFLACQVECNEPLNHVESGILIFNGKHQDKRKFAITLKSLYRLGNILKSQEPYDGFLIFKTLLKTNIKYTNLNEEYGKGGIQSDPNMTFCHPEISSKFIHNIGWTGKNQYENWDKILKKDYVFRVMKNTIFNISSDEQLNLKKQNAFNKMQKLKQFKIT